MTMRQIAYIARVGGQWAGKKWRSTCDEQVLPDNENEEEANKEGWCVGGPRPRRQLSRSVRGSLRAIVIVRRADKGQDCGVGR